MKNPVYKIKNQPLYYEEPCLNDKILTFVL